MYFLIHGEDSFRSRRALGASKAKFQKDRDASGFNIITLRTEDGLDRARQELFASPFLAERKMLILEGFCGLPKKEQEELIEALKLKPETTVAVFFEEADPKKLAKSPLFEVLAKQKYSLEHQAMTAAESGRFVTAEASAAGIRFEAAALRATTETIGPDSWRLHHEVAKLSARILSQKRDTVTAADVEEMVSGSREESVFAFIDACTDGNGLKSLTSLEALLEAGESEVQIVSLLQRHFRLIAMARDLMSRGLTQAAAMPKLDAHPFAARKAWGAALKYDSKFLGQTLRKLAKMERDLKSSGTRPRVSLNLFIADLTDRACATKKPRA